MKLGLTSLSPSSSLAAIPELFTFHTPPPLTMSMITPLSLLFSLLLTLSPHLSSPLSSPHLSPTTLLPNYQKMLTHFKIYPYNPPKPSFTFTTPSQFLFNNSLFNSPFLTLNPDQAHLFFVPFPANLSKRSLTRYLRDLRINFPYWNRSLAADHFFLSRAGIGYEPDRNLLELKKNAVQISCFGTVSGNFIPHKDITLPSLLNPSPLALPHAPINVTASYLGYFYNPVRTESSLVVDQLKGDDEFLVQSEPLVYGDGLGKSKFCLFLYGDDVIEIGDALGFGCVPVVISDRPIKDLPFMDVLKWSEIAVFVGSSGGVEGLKAALSRIGEDRYERMRELGVTAAQHFVWNEWPQPYDAFNMVMYQLWLRRHAIRYARRESV